MHDSEKAQFVQLLTEVMSYYAKDMSSNMVKLYWDALKRFDFGDVSRGFSLHAQSPDTGQFWPKVADLVKMIEGSTVSQGMLAWAKVQAAIGSVGRNRSVAFDDPLVHVVIEEMGGWYALCSCKADELPFKARDFEKRYQSYKSRREIPPFRARLVGGHESDNRMNGYEGHTQPYLVGDVQRATKVLERGSEKGAIRITDSRDVAAIAAKRLGVDMAPPRIA